MRIGLVAPPFIPVPPVAYGGTELFISHLLHGLVGRGHQVTVYANGQSQVPCRLKWRYFESDWPLTDLAAAHRKNIDHAAWAIKDAEEAVDVLHLQDAVGVPFTRLVRPPVVLTLHHPHEPMLSEMYLQHPDVAYVAISEAQRRREPMPKVAVVHHGVEPSNYAFSSRKQGYLAFLGRIAPCKGAHIACEVARRSGLPLKLAGEVQPAFQEYWRQRVLPYVGHDGIEYVGEADHARKNELLSRARALLFPIDWDEPFGLVMIEAMACGTPVLAFDRGSVPEIVRDGLSGWICRDVAEMAARAIDPAIPAEWCREWVASRFSTERMVDDYLAIYERVMSGRAPVETKDKAAVGGDPNCDPDINDCVPAL
jgi:glycosyltransferase involved in cell wall biosynthesis